jgi:hypothetical protein
VLVAIIILDHDGRCVKSFRRSSQFYTDVPSSADAIFLAGWMCKTCPGCALANPTRGTSSELIYHFSIEAPFKVLFVDAYSAGKYSGFEGNEIYLIASCGMMGFSMMETSSHPNSTTFAAAIMKIQLCYGFCHTIVLDKDSKILGYSKKPST